MSINLFVICLAILHPMMILVVSQDMIYPSQEDWQKATNLSSTIHSDFWRNIIEHELVYCPSNFYCNPNHEPSDSDWFFYTPCCKACSCDAMCSLSGTCCPTMLMPNASQFVSSLPVPNPGLQYGYCSLPQQLHFKRSLNFNQKNVYDTLNADDKYLIIDQCPFNWTDQAVHHHCLTDSYMTFNKTQISTPVTSRISKLSYRNMACAQCHNENESSLDAWTPIVKCLHPLSMSVLSSIYEKVLIDETCNLIFRPPFELPSCDWGIVSKCNETGLWENYDSDIEKACLAYTSVYQHHYRNIFCYICNSNDAPITLCEIVGSDPIGSEFSFSGIFNFADVFNELKSEADQTELTKDTCPKGTIETKNVCLEIHCTYPLFYDKNNRTCKPMIAELTNTGYSVSINFTPTTKIRCTTCLYDLGENLKDYIDQIIRNENLVFNTCAFSVYFTASGVKDTFEIKNFIVLIDFFLDAYHNYHNQLLNLVNAFDKQILEIPIDENIIELKSNLLDDFSQHHVAVQFPENVLYFNLNNEILHLVFHQKDFMKAGCAISNSEYKVVSEMSLHPYVNIPSARFDAASGTVTSQLLTRRLQQGEFALDENETIKVPVDLLNELNSQSKFQPDAETKIFTAEDILSIICISITILCLAITITTYCLFRTLRSIPGLNNMHLCISLLIANVLFLVSNNLKPFFDLCLVVGLMTHLFWLFSMFWLNSCCIHMFNVFRSIDKVSRESKSIKTLIFYNIYALSASLIFITINIAYSKIVKTSFGYGSLVCFITHPLMNLITFALPVAIVVLSNLLMFLWVIVTIQRLKNGAQSTATRNCLLIYIKLSVLTGFSWIFGYLHEFTKIRAFSFLFIIFTATQGLFIMLAFVCNRRVLNLYKNLFVDKNLQTLSKTLSSTIPKTQNSFSQPIYRPKSDDSAL